MSKDKNVFVINFNDPRIPEEIHADFVAVIERFVHFVQGTSEDNMVVGLYPIADIKSVYRKDVK
jgi:hypothetical protein